MAVPIQEEGQFPLVALPIQEQGEEGLHEFIDLREQRRRHITIYQEEVVTRFGVEEEGGDYNTIISLPMVHVKEEHRETC